MKEAVHVEAKDGLLEIWSDLSNDERLVFVSTAASSAPPKTPTR